MYYFYLSIYLPTTKKSYSIYYRFFFLQLISLKNDLYFNILIIFINDFIILMWYFLIRNYEYR